MPETTYRLASATASNMTSNVDDITVDTRNTDGIIDQDETAYDNAKWSQYFGYYKVIPEVKTAIDMRAIWTLGKGYKADPETTIILDHISGFGRDTFNSILKNMIVTRRIGGDSFTEIIRDEKTGILLNLKPLDSGSMRIIVGKNGILKRYEQLSKTGKGNQPIKFKPNEIKN